MSRGQTYETGLAPTLTCRRVNMGLWGEILDLDRQEEAAYQGGTLRVMAGRL